MLKITLQDIYPLVPEIDSYARTKEIFDERNFRQTQFPTKQIVNEKLCSETDFRCRKYRLWGSTGYTRL